MKPAFKEWLEKERRDASSAESPEKRQAVLGPRDQGKDNDPQGQGVGSHARKESEPAAGVASAETEPIEGVVALKGGNLVSQHSSIYLMIS